jgi:hypothetical protein
MSKIEGAQETATFYADDMIIEVCNDHGEIDNFKNPAQAHLKKADGTFLGTFAITKQAPSDKAKVVDCMRRVHTLCTLRTLRVRRVRALELKFLGAI